VEAFTPLKMSDPSVLQKEHFKRCDAGEGSINEKKNVFKKTKKQPCLKY